MSGHNHDNTAYETSLKTGPSPIGGQSWCSIQTCLIITKSGLNLILNHCQIPYFFATEL